MTETQPQWVDFHCHLDLYPDHIALIAECEREQIATLAVTTTPKAWRRNRDLASGKFVQVGLGLHPQLVVEREQEIDLWEELLPQTRLVGEVGLDAGPRFYSSFEKQKRVFTRVLKACARAGDKVLSVHSVRCATTVLKMLEEHLPAQRGKVVLHWFSGTVAEARKAHALGCYFSVNSNMLRSNGGRSLVAAIDLDRIVTETDGPFGTVDGRPARPTDIRSLVGELATLRHVSTDSLQKRIVQNWSSLVV